jgi:DNA-binding NarL/FixJ family response regulator
MRKITILLADDHKIIRQGLRALLAMEADFEIVGEAMSGREAVMLVQKLCPNIVIMDLAMPLLNGVEAARQIASRCGTTKIIVLSAYEDDEHIQSVVAAGAAGYLLKATASRDLMRAIRNMHAGHAYFSPQIAKRLSETSNFAFTKRNPLNGLTVREAEVLQLIAEGFANKHIAEELCIGMKTVEKHRQTLMNKLKLHCTADLVRHAIAKGVIDTCDVKSTVLNVLATTGSS